MGRINGKQSGHYNNLPPKLNSIHHKGLINTGKVEGVNSASYNKSCKDEMRWDGDGDGDGAGGEDDVDDDLDDASDDDDDDDDGDDLPFQEVFSPAESAR